MKTLFVTGTSGYIGGTVALRLIEAGYRVRGLVRRADTAERLEAIGIIPVIGSLDDADLLAEEASNSDGVINAASADHATSVSALIRGLRGSGKPLIHTSGASVVGDDARGGFCTDAVFSENSELLIERAKQPRRDIDLQVLDAHKANIRSLVICPGLVYGEGRGLSTESYQIPFLVANARQAGKVQIVGPGLNVWSNVHVDDLADLYLLALRGSPAGAFYFAENGETAFADVGRALASRLALPGPEHLDAEIAAAQWGVMKAHFSLGSNSRVRSSRARRDLGWSPSRQSLLEWIRGDMRIDIHHS